MAKEWRKHEKVLMNKGLFKPYLGSNPPLPTKRNLNRTTLWRLGFSFFTRKYKIVLRAFLWGKETLFIMP